MEQNKSRPIKTVVETAPSAKAVDRRLLTGWHDLGLTIRATTKLQFSKGYELAAVYGVISY